MAHDEQRKNLQSNHTTKRNWLITHVELLGIYPLSSAGVNWSEARGWDFLTVNAECRKFATRDMFTKYMLSSAVNWLWIILFKGLIFSTTNRMQCIYFGPQYKKFAHPQADTVKISILFHFSHSILSY